MTRSAGGDDTLALRGSASHLTLSLPDEEATRRLGQALARSLTRGDTVLLSGEVGAGKTALARAVIQSAQEMSGQGPEDVPSPTFTLVQTYRTAGPEIWHADLYRLTDPSEIDELGLLPAFDDAICLIEWPDRLGDLRPSDAIEIALDMDGPGRRARLTAPSRLIDALSEQEHPV
ncbi:tRNA (adenosine(37)-N6)-threonylcarbamoyltransferase complex ATPase subunit type 1 TsaE [Jannaschia aquimarina]|nr:tRNA (adenosine(37)-N6)-threonylcarbamoyltransferase complex ATPase subunit type 1 TsaE [Jannaschia aquimarina]